MQDVIIIMLFGIALGTILYFPAMFTAYKRHFVKSCLMFAAMVGSVSVYDHDKVLSLALVVIVWIISIITSILIEIPDKQKDNQ